MQISRKCFLKVRSAPVMCSVSSTSADSSFARTYTMCLPPTLEEKESVQKISPVPLTHGQVMLLFDEYLDLRDQEVVNEPFVAPPVCHPAHPYTKTFRHAIINWMYQVSRDAFTQNLILHHAVHLMDAVAPYMTTDAEGDGRGHPLIQLVAVCSINLMQKIHADFSDLFQQIQKSVSGEFTLEMCEYTELAIVKIGRPGIRRPTLMGFARLYNKIVPVSRRTGWLMTYLCDLVLVHAADCHLRRVRFSVAAAAIYALAVGTVNYRDGLNISPWPHDLTKFTRIDFDGATGDLLSEVIYDIFELQSSFAVTEQGFLPSELLRKYRSANCLSVASYRVMDRKFLGEMMDCLKVTAQYRREEVRGFCNEPGNLIIRKEPRSPSPAAADGAISGIKGRYFSNPAIYQKSGPKKQRLSDPDELEF